MVIMVLTLVSLCERRCWHVLMESSVDADGNKWLLYGLPHSLPILTIRSAESSTNKRRYRMEQQIIEDRLLTNGRVCSKDNVNEFVRAVQQLSSNEWCGNSGRKMENESSRIGGDQFYTPETVRRQQPNQASNKKSSESNSVKLSKDKRVTFHPSHAKEGLTSESDNGSDGMRSRKAAEIDECTWQDTDSTLTDVSMPDLRASVHRASSESKLSKDVDFHRTISSQDNLSSRTTMKKALFRSASDRTLSTGGNSTLSPLGRKDKKRRSILKRKFSKIHKVFRKKRTNASLEESEEAIEYPPGSDDSENASTSSECREANGLLNSQDELDGKQPLPVRSHSLPRSHRKSGLSSSKTSSRSSSFQQSSRSSFELDSTLHGDRSTFPRLKPNSTSPAALNTLDDSQRDESVQASPRLTPTYSNFDESQLINPSMGIAYHPHSHTLRIRNERMTKSSNSPTSKNASFRKKKRSSSWYNVLSPSYKQKNEDFHKFFKDLPVSERLLVDYACALVKDILVQGRLYVSQNYLCFHSTILKWQTAVTVNLVDIDQMTKEKTVKVIPNAIQILLKDKTKITFTSFTARDRAYLTVFRLWQNALLDKPMTGMELWSQIHRNYGEELGGCSSDDDYVRPKQMPRKHQSIDELDGGLKYEFGTTNKIKKKSPSVAQAHSKDDIDKDKSDSRSIKSRQSSQDSPTRGGHATDSLGDDKSTHSSRGTPDDISVTDNTQHVVEEEGSLEDAKCRSKKSSNRDEDEIRYEESDDEPSVFLMQDLPKLSFSITYDTSVQDLYRIIFSDDCPFWKETLVNKGTTGITFGTWNDDETTDGQRIRDLSYTLRLDNSIGPKTSFVKETQICYSCSVEGKSYVVDCIAQNYGIPYADYFYTAMRYCFRKVTRTSCELRITWELRYKKSPWGLVKNFIEKNVASGMNENFKKLKRQLQTRIEYEKSQPQLFRTKSDGKSGGLRRRKRKSTSPTTSTPQEAESTKKSTEETSVVARPSDMNNNKNRNTSPDVAAGVPPIYPPNGFIPNQVHTYETESPKLHYFGQGGKFIFGVIIFLFVLLLYSNYNMYQRLTTLEQVTAAAATADGVDPSVTAALLDRPGVQITSNPEILSAYLQAIDKRLRRLEDTVSKFTKESNSKWEKFEKSWKSLENFIEKIASQDGQKER